MSIQPEMYDYREGVRPPKKGDVVIAWNTSYRVIEAHADGHFRCLEVASPATPIWPCDIESVVGQERKDDQ